MEKTGNKELTINYKPAKAKRWVDERAKNNEANFQHLDRTSSVNKGLFILWPKRFEAFEDFFFTYSFIY